MQVYINYDKSCTSMFYSDKYVLKVLNKVHYFYPTVPNAKDYLLCCRFEAK